MSTITDHALLIRQATTADLPAITTLFRDTIRHVNKKDYDAKQIETWSGRHRLTERWQGRLDRQDFRVAVLGETIVGIASLEGSYLDVLYVHHLHQGQGIARLLLQTLEEKARQDGHIHMQSDVSITARPFFESQGFTVQRENRVEIEGVFFTNFRVEKGL